jgi:intracellular sulfur oxidation DsrE/DsrF family protein
MKAQLINKMFLSLIGAVALLGMTAVQAADKHKLVIQVSSGDQQTQTIALNNAVNLQKSYGMDNVDIEIVAYGPGLGMLTAKSKNAQRVASLAEQNITFSACGNTMKKIAKKTGKQPQLADGVGVVPGGVVRIMELQEAGYSYIRP